MSLSVLSGLSVRDGQYRHRALEGALSVLVINLMPNQLTMEKQLLHAWMSVRENLNIDFALLTTQIETMGDAAEIAETYKQYQDVKDNHYDVMFVTGSPYDGRAESEIPFWQDFVGLIDWAKDHVAYTYYAGWSAAGALQVNYGIHVPHKRKKIFGVFAQSLVDDVVFAGMQEPYLMPVSRWFSFTDVKLPEALRVLSRDAVSGPGVIADAGDRTLYVTGHPTVQGMSLHDEYEHELAEGRVTAPPTNLQYVNGRPFATWAANATLFFENWFGLIGRELGK